MGVMACDVKAELLNAIKNQEFILHYQPQFNLLSGQFEGVEALVRWAHPKHGILLPAEFIPHAEESDLIVHLGEWVLKTACLQVKHWQDKGLSTMRVAVNVSGRQFQQKNFVELVMAVLQEAKLNSESLELEITENIIIHDDDERIIQTIHRLKKLGVQIALDDFGTGYSSISYLKKIPVDRIKIDRTFIQNINEQIDDAAIVKAIIALATSLNLHVLAEGVETLQQLELLLSQECKEAQGYYFSKPLPAEEVEKFLLFHQNRKFL